MAAKDQSVPLIDSGSNREQQGRGDHPANRLGQLAGALVWQQDAMITTLQLSDDHHGAIIDFLASNAVTVTVPAGLRDDFYCGISQGGTGQVAIQAGSGASVVEQNGLFKTAQRYALVSVLCFHANSYRLFGSLG